MNKFELVAKPGKIALSFALAIGIGAAALLVSYGLIGRFSSWTATRIMPIALGIGALVAVGMAMSTLFGTIKKIELDEQALRLRMLAGGVKEYRLAENQFAPKITHQTNRGQHVGTTRALQVVGPHGTDTHTVTFEPEEFNELIHRLTGRNPVAPHLGAAAGQMGPGAHATHAGTAGGPGAAPVAASRMPLDFQPQSFTLTDRPMRGAYVALIISCVVIAAIGVLMGVLLYSEEPAPALVMMGLFLALAGLFLVLMLSMRKKLAKIPKQVVVAPTWISFDGRTFNYSDLKVIQIKPAGALVDRSAKILTNSDERVVYPLGYQMKTKIFPEYDQFAHLLEQAGNAAAGVVRIDWS